MDLCIKTIAFLASRENSRRVSILVLMDLCIKTEEDKEGYIELGEFQSLF